MTRITQDQFQSKVNLINKRLGTNYEICNQPIYGGRCLITIDPINGAESHVNYRMGPQVFFAYLQGMIQATVTQQRIYQVEE